MLMSLDGKINSGDSDELDVDRDWCKIDGKAISKVEELGKLKALKLMECNVLQDSYIQLKYEVLK